MTTQQKNVKNTLQQGNHPGKGHLKRQSGDRVREDKFFFENPL